ncbi:MAG: rod shape-determining protein MreC [bacterium]
MTISYKLLIISVLVFLLGGTIPFIYIRSLFYKVTFPIQFGIHGVSLSVVEEVSFLKKVRWIKEELFELYKVKEHSLGLEAKIAEVELENKILRSQISLKEISSKKILSYVIGSPFGSSSTALTLNSGSKDGVVVGLAVIYDNFLVGLVSDVSLNSCIVKLLNSPETKISVLSQNTRAKGILVGNYGTTAVIKNILISEVINIEDVIITSGEDSYIPKGLIVGKVVKINFKEQEILKTADIELTINPRDLEMVFVLGN